MDPNPKSFPILSYVMSRIASFKAPQAVDHHDIEQPPPLDRPIRGVGGGDIDLVVERLPRLQHPALLASMASAITEVAQTRSVLRLLGDRPDHEAVDAARARPPPPPRGAEAEREKAALRVVIQLDEMHEAYEKLLREAENRLVKMYGSAAEGGDVGDGKQGADMGQEEGGDVNEEVIDILQGGPGKSLERVDLSGRHLRYLPEAFGKLRGLLYLNLSNNQLEVCHLLLSRCRNIFTVVGGNLILVHVKFRSLVELNASYNELTYLPTNIGHELQSLEKLWIHLNKLRSLPTSVCEMRALRLLDAHFNELRGLPYAIGNLSNLEVMNLSSNFSDLQELPASFGDLINLRELDLSNNQIHALPDTFGRLEKLTKLNLDQNPLVVPPLEVVTQGVEAVKDYMAKRLLDILLEEEKSMAEEMSPTQAGNGWLMRSTSWLNSWVSGVSGSVAGYLGAGQKSFRDPYLDQQL
ncbi:hypothetical protein B296_00024383 [Ensete ventricosum]|uniref:Uncharacterized protein n=1 Tax=Ensete ventricosum TaxID=4639 RepID=A0A427A6M7_ENSVE|nr:hypothetical protein B296_00024383 [Ensete ventricosum]